MSSKAAVAPASEATEPAPDRHARWPKEKANDWYEQRPWMVGCNYIPASASNQLEMWQAETFDLARIDLELGWAAQLGFNSVRVFLHDLLWEQDAQSFAARIDRYLCVAARHRIGTLFVLFDSCWNPCPKLGPQEPPREGIHNSRWVQSPGCDALADSSSYPRLQRYVEGVLSSFRDDSRIIAWDLWNEPDNDNCGSYRKTEISNKLALVAELLPQVFEWGRNAGPSHPLTSGLWYGEWAVPADLTPIQRTQIERSDVISFHSYEGARKFDASVVSLEPYGRPVLCTEYMARSCGSIFRDILPVANIRQVAAFNWGLVAGKTQTMLPWTSWQDPSLNGDEIEWFHEILRNDGCPYSASEVEFISQLTKSQRTRRDGRATMQRQVIPSPSF